uniref:Uncharacterized protein n=1 Tax=Anguilla anguilla TaxID=7936 RepID=A0A0E9WEB3_ANGAN
MKDLKQASGTLCSVSGMQDSGILLIKPTPLGWEEPGEELGENCCLRFKVKHSAITWPFL